MNLRSTAFLETGHYSGSNAACVSNIYSKQFLFRVFHSSFSAASPAPTHNTLPPVSNSIPNVALYPGRVSLLSFFAGLAIVFPYISCLIADL